MSQKFFKRDEKKYLLSALEYHTIIAEVQRHMQPDKFFQSSVFNVYFDTPQDDLVIASISSPNYKYKVRARSYGKASKGTVFLEIKSKLDGTVYKRRAEMNDHEYKTYLASGTTPDDGQVMREVDYLFKGKQLEPKMFIAYERQAFAAKDDSDLRVTFDANLRSRSHNLDLNKTSDCDDYFEEPTIIMEIKSHGGMPAWLIDTLSTHQIYPSSFSKYGQIYQKERAAAYAMPRLEVAYA